MNATASSPRLLKYRNVSINMEAVKVPRIVSLQYNSDGVMRGLQIQVVNGGSSGPARSVVLRPKPPSIETIKLEAEIHLGKGRSS